jgi:tetratricopeptide (TPR) repeat protein
VSFVAKWLSRARAPEEDLDLTPPEELRAQKRRRWLLWILSLAVVLLVAGGFAARPVRDYVRGWQSRRAARTAFALIDRQQWDEASAKARDALQLKFTEPQAWRAIARLLSRTDQDASALEWWKKIEQAALLTLEDRRDYARSAIAAGEASAAATQIDFLLAQKGGPAPIDNLLAAHLAVRRGDTVRSADYADRVLTDKRARPNDVLSAAILILGITKSDSPPHINAWKQIQDIARDPGNGESLNALVFLAQQPKPIAAATSAGTSQPVTTISAGEIADRLEKHPKALPFHHLLALKVRASEDRWQANDLLNRATERYRGGDDQTLMALNSWLYAEGRYQTILDIMPLERALQRRELFLQYLDTLGGLGRFDVVRDLLRSERFPLEPVLQHMYLATSNERLGESTAVANEWQRALETADNETKCLALATYAEKAGAADIADSAYVKAISFAPNTRAAYDARVRLAEAHGQTAKAQKILSEIVRLWPDDDHERNHEMYLRLLLGASGADAEKAVREGEVLMAQEPFNWQARATVALGQLRLAHPAAALDAFKGIKAEESSPVGPLTVRAVALDANGWKEGAKGDARTLSAAALLPEERALIAPLLSD